VTVPKKILSTEEKNTSGENRKASQKRGRADGEKKEENKTTIRKMIRDSPALGVKTFVRLKRKAHRGSFRGGSRAILLVQNKAYDQRKKGKSVDGKSTPLT